MRSKSSWRTHTDQSSTSCLARGNQCEKLWSAWWKTAWPTRRSLFAAKYEQVAAELGENVHATCHGWKGTGFVCQPGMVREEIVFGDDECLCMRAYVENRGVDTQQTQEQIGATKCRKGSAWPWQPRFFYPKSRKSHETRRHASVNRTDTQTTKVLTMQMKMTWFWRQTDWVSSTGLNEEYA